MSETDQDTDLTTEDPATEGTENEGTTETPTYTVQMTKCEFQMYLYEKIRRILKEFRLTFFPDGDHDKLLEILDRKEERLTEVRGLIEEYQRVAASASDSEEPADPSKEETEQPE